LEPEGDGAWIIKDAILEELSGDKAKGQSKLEREFDQLEECGEAEFEAKDGEARVDCFKESLDFFQELPMIIVKVREETHSKSMDRWRKADSLEKIWHWAKTESIASHLMGQLKRQVIWFPTECFCVYFVSVISIATLVGVTVGASEGNREMGVGWAMFTLLAFFFIAVTATFCIAGIRGLYARAPSQMVNAVSMNGGIATVYPSPDVINLQRISSDLVETFNLIDQQRLCTRQSQEDQEGGNDQVMENPAAEKEEQLLQKLRSNPKLMKLVEDAVQLAESQTANVSE